MRRALVPAGLATLLVISLAGVASAGASRITFESVLIDTTAVLPAEAPGANWVSGSIWHVRRAVVEDTVTGDLAGSLDRLVNFNLNLTTGESTAWCSFTWTAQLDTWDGRCRGSLLSGTLNGRGSNGTLMRGTYELAPAGIPAVGPYLLSGELLVPGN